MCKIIIKNTVIIFLMLTIVLSMFTCGVSVSASDDIDLDDYVFPLLGKTVNVTSPHGKRFINGNKDYHNGIDIGVAEGSPVVAWKSGTVAKIISGCKGSHPSGKCRCSSSWGNYIVIYHGTKNNHKIHSGYAHLSKINVKVGDKVGQGETIGKSGNTGNSYGAHLHFEIYKGECDNAKNRVNPTPYIGISNTRGIHNINKYMLKEISISAPDMHVQRLSNTKIKLNWNSPNGNTYTVEQKVNSNSWKTILNKTKKTSYTFSGLEPGKKYSYRVKSHEEKRDSEYSDVKTFMPLSKTKNVKVSFTKEKPNDKFKSNSVVKVSWDKVSNATKYDIYRKTGSKSYTKKATVSSNSFIDTKLIGGKIYKYKVKAVNEETSGEFSDATSIKPMNTPKITSVKINSNTSVTVTAKKVSGATSYRVYKRLATNEDYSFVSSSSTPSFKINNLKKGKKYYFRVTALNNDIITDKSPARSFQSLAKSELTKCLLKNNSTVKLQWKEIAGAKRYNLKYTNETTKKTYSKNLKGTYATINNLESGKIYTFTVRAVRGRIYGDYSAKKVAKPIGKPEITYVGLNTTDSSLIKWKSVSGASEYKVYRRVNSGKYAPYKTIKNNVTSFTDTSLKENTTYYYYIVATQGKNKSEKSNVVDVRRISGTPVLSCTEKDNSSITLKWSTISGAKGYNLYRKTNNEPYRKIKSLNSKNYTYEDTTTVADNSYTYVVKGFSGNVSTPSSNGITYKPLAKPSVSSANFTSINSLTVKWQKNNNVDGYVLYSTTDNGEWTKIYSGDKLSYTDSEASVVSEYKFRIRTYYVDNGKTYYSSFSNTVTASYKEDLPIPVPSITYVSGDTWVYAMTSEDQDSEYVFQYAYSLSRNSGYTASKITFKNEYKFSGLKVDTEYYFKVRVALAIGSGKYIYSDYSSPQKISTHKRYTFSTYKNVIDLGNMFNVTANLVPSLPGPSSAGSNVYIYSTSELKASASNFITKYKTAITESGGTYTEKTVGTSTITTFEIDNDTYYLGYNNNVVAISNAYSEIADLI